MLILTIFYFDSVGLGQDGHSASKHCVEVHNSPMCYSCLACQDCNMLLGDEIGLMCSAFTM